jgi:ankyrin repeat protein
MVSRITNLLSACDADTGDSRKGDFMKKQLPSRPNLEQLKNQAKSLLKDHRAALPEVLARVRGCHPRWQNASDAVLDGARLTLADAQLVIAHEYGFETWPELKTYVLSQQAGPYTEATIRSLQDAAGRGDLAQLDALLTADPGLINETAGPGVRTALHHAVFGKSEAGARFLLDRGADPNIRCEGDNAYPLHFAAEKQLFPIIRLLIEHGADPRGEGDYHELGVIGWATAWEYVHASREIVEYLLTHGARHNISSAVATGDTEAILQLISRSPADLERRMDMANRRRRPLHLAVIKKQPQALVALLNLGANTESIDEARFTALDQAALIGETEMAQILLDRGAKVRLPAAVCLGRTRDIDRLLRRDPGTLKPGGRWGNLILRASEQAPDTVIETLIQAGASVDVRDDPKTSVDSTFGFTPLHAAAFNGNLSAATALLKHGANVQVREEKYHGTPAGWADYAGHTEVRDLILREPVDIMEAAQHGLTQRIQAILEEDPGALNRPFQDYPLYPLDNEGWHTLLGFAVTTNKPKLVRFLLDRGADAEICSPEGRTLYEIAKEKHYEEVTEMLAHRDGRECE